MNCTYDSQTLACVRCGHKARRLPTYRMCSGGLRFPRVDVGNLVERMLTGVGITKERVQAWTRLKNCGCASRQRWLTRWGYDQQDRIERLLNKAAKWYGIN